MTLTLKESITINFNDGDKFIEGVEIFNEQTIIIDFEGSIPVTWEYIGTVFRLLQINGIWTIAESKTLVPGKPNQITWDDGSTYRLAYRLVKYIKPGILQAYGFAPSNNDEFSLVAFSGDYNDLINKPVGTGSTPQDFSYASLTGKPVIPFGFTFDQAELPINPANGNTWLERDSLGLAKDSWVWDASLSKWLSEVDSVSFVSPALTTTADRLATIKTGYARPVVIESSSIAIRIGSGTWRFKRIRAALNQSVSSSLIVTDIGVDSPDLMTGFHSLPDTTRVVVDDSVGVAQLGYVTTRVSASGNIAIQFTYRFRLVRA